MTFAGLGIFEAREDAAKTVDAEAGGPEAYDDDGGGQEEYEEDEEAGEVEEGFQDFDGEAWAQMPFAAGMSMPWSAAAACAGVGMPFWPMGGACGPCGGAMPGSARAGPMSRYRGSLKQRFCATFPSVNRCRHGAACAFAHSREEVSAPLLTPEEETYVPEALTSEFFTDRFKVFWCPIGGQHDWHSCMYAHTYQDVRRPPSIGYGHQLCPYWNKKDTSLPYSQRCPLGPRCPYAHGAKEQLYHPGYFRTLVCRDLQRRRCPRGQLCAFYHKPSDERASGADSHVDYNRPLDKSQFPEDWFHYFMNPPRFQDVCDGPEDMPFVAFSDMVPPKDDALQESIETPRTRAHSGDSLDGFEAAASGRSSARRTGAASGRGRGAARGFQPAMGYWDAYGAALGGWGAPPTGAGLDSSYPAYAGMGYLTPAWDPSYPMYAPGPER